MERLPLVSDNALSETKTSVIVSLNTDFTWVEHIFLHVETVTIINIHFKWFMKRIQRRRPDM